MLPVTVIARSISLYLATKSTNHSNFMKSLYKIDSLVRHLRIFRDISFRLNPLQKPAARCNKPDETRQV